MPGPSAHADNHIVSPKRTSTTPITPATAVSAGVEAGLPPHNASAGAADVKQRLPTSASHSTNGPPLGGADHAPRGGAGHTNGATKVAASAPSSDSHVWNGKNGRANAGIATVKQQGLEGAHGAPAPPQPVASTSKVPMQSGLSNGHHGPGAVGKVPRRAVEVEPVSAAIGSAGYGAKATSKGTSKRKGKARRIDVEIRGVPVEELEAELRPEVEGLVPLGAIVARLANYGFETFQNLGETLPSLSSRERRAKIFNAVLDVRQQMIKLLVLVQWSKVAPDLQRARNLINLICEQHGQVEDCVNVLTETRKQLASAGMRSADLATAVDVLGTGKTQRLPKSLTESAMPPVPLSDDEVLSLVNELNDAIRLRLACEEVVPTALSAYTIDDGHATFRVPGLFEASVTLSGDGAEDRWWCMGVRFDFRIIGAGREVFPQRPVKQARVQLLALADAELAPQSPAAAAEDANDAEAHDPEDVGVAGHREEVGDGPSIRRDAPLLRLFLFLQRSALNYQLDILHFQATQLARQDWGTTLVVRRTAERTLHVEYWRGRPAPPPAGRQGAAAGRRTTAPRDPTLGAAIRFGPRPIQAAESLRRQTLRRMLSAPAEHLAVGKQRDGIEADVEALEATWDVAGVPLLAGEQTRLEYSPHELDLEALLTRQMRKHAVLAMRACREELLRSHLGLRLSEGRCRVVNGGAQGPPSLLLLLPLHERVDLQLRIDVYTGLLALEARPPAAQRGPTEASQRRVDSTIVSAAALAATPSAARVQHASSLVRREPALLVAVLQQLVVSAMIEDLQHKAGYLGLRCLRSMPLRQQAYTLLGAKAADVLFVPLPQCPQYYLALHCSQGHLRVGLVFCVAYLEGMSTAMTLQSVQWLDVDRITGRNQAHRSRKRKRGAAAADAVIEDISSPVERSADVGSSDTLSAADLRSLYSYSVALLGYHKIEQQLYARGLAFVHVNTPDREHCKMGAADGEAGGHGAVHGKGAPRDGDGVGGAKAGIPSLCVRAQQMLGTSHALVKPNVSVRLCRWLEPASCRVEVRVKLRMRLGADTGGSVAARQSPSAAKAVAAAGAGSDSLSLDSDGRLLTFATGHVEGCIGRFLHCWARVTKVAMLAREVARMARRRVQPGLRLRNFDLDRVCFEFAAGMRVAVVRWLNDAMAPRGGRYELAFETPAGPVSPGRGAQVEARAAEPPDPPDSSPRRDRPSGHDFLLPALQRALNAGDDASTRFWPSFVQLLHDVAAVADCCAELDVRSLDEVEYPEVEVLSTSHLRLSFSPGYALEVSLLSGSRILIADARHSRPSTRALPADDADEAEHEKQEDEEEVPSSPDSSRPLLDTSPAAKTNRTSAAKPRPPPRLPSAASLPSLPAVPNFARLAAHAVREVLSASAKQRASAAAADDHGAESTTAPAAEPQAGPVRPTPPALWLGTGILCDAKAGSTAGEVLRALVEGIVRQQKQGIGG